MSSWDFTKNGERILRLPPRSTMPEVGCEEARCHHAEDFQNQLHPPTWITMSLCLSICGITMDNLHSQQSLFIQDWHYLTPLTLQHWESNSYNATILKWHWQGLWLGLPHYMTCLGACKALACLMPGRTQTIYILCYRSIQRFLCSLSCKKETQFFQRK